MKSERDACRSAIGEQRTALTNCISRERQMDAAMAGSGDPQKEQLMAPGRGRRADYRPMPLGTVGQINDTDGQTDGRTHRTPDGRQGQMRGDTILID